MSRTPPICYRPPASTGTTIHEAIEAAAEAAGLTRGEWLGQAVEVALGMRPAVVVQVTEDVYRARLVAELRVAHCPPHGWASPFLLGDMHDSCPECGGYYISRVTDLPDPGGPMRHARESGQGEPETAARREAADTDKDVTP